MIAALKRFLLAFTAKGYRAGGVVQKPEPWFDPSTGMWWIG